MNMYILATICDCEVRSTYTLCCLHHMCTICILSITYYYYILLDSKVADYRSVINISGVCTSGVHTAITTYICTSRGRRCGLYNNTSIYHGYLCRWYIYTYVCGSLRIVLLDGVCMYPSGCIYTVHNPQAPNLVRDRGNCDHGLREYQIHICRSNYCGVVYRYTVVTYIYRTRTTPDTLRLTTYVRTREPYLRTTYAPEREESAYLYTVSVVVDFKSASVCTPYSI